MRSRPDLPSLEQSRELARWLAGPRGRLLRRVQIGRKSRVLEIGAGHGMVTRELLRRAAGNVVCIDTDPRAAASLVRHGAQPIAADACDLPLADGCVDLVFCQNVLMWTGDLSRAIEEAARVLQPGGAVVALEPDYGGMIEHPAHVSLQDLWLSALRAAGADPLVGRAIPGLCEKAGLQVWVELQNIPSPPTPDGPQLLLGLPLSGHERARVEEAARALEEMPGTWEAFIHVPYVLVVATRA